MILSAKVSTSLYHRQFGCASDVGDGIPVIILHGLFGSLENLGMIARLLSDSHTIYSIDLPNHGRSDHTDTVTLLSMANDVIAWMEENSIERAHFLGHSLGGKISMEIALRSPEKVASLVVADIAPVTYTHRHDDIFAAFRAVDLESVSTRADADEVMSAYVEELSTRNFLLKNLERGEQGWFWRVNLDALIGAYGELVAANASECPPFEGNVLFIKGELSPYILPEHREEILKRFPRASVKVINNTNHWLHVEKPDIFSNIVKRFLAAGNFL